MERFQEKLRKKAYCPFCGTLLCTGINGEDIQIKCTNKRCGKLIEINFTEDGVKTIEVFSRARDSPSKFKNINN